MPRPATSTFAKAKFDDSKWRTLNLPHDWAVELPFVRDDEQKSHGYKPLGRRYPETSVGWYRREFEIPASDLGRRIWVEFDGAFRDVLVFVNGCFIGRNNNGYAPFRFDLTDFLAYGAKNYIARPRRCQFRRRLVLRGRGNLSARVADQDRCRASGQVGEQRARRTVNGNSATLALATVVQNEGKQAAQRQGELEDPRCRRRNRRDSRSAGAINRGRRVRDLPGDCASLRIPRSGRSMSRISTPPS